MDLARILNPVSTSTPTLHRRRCPICNSALLEDLVHGRLDTLTVEDISNLWRPDPCSFCRYLGNTLVEVYGHDCLADAQKKFGTLGCQLRRLGEEPGPRASSLAAQSRCQIEVQLMRAHQRRLDLMIPLSSKWAGFDTTHVRTLDLSQT